MGGNTVPLVGNASMNTQPINQQQPNLLQSVQNRGLKQGGVYEYFDGFINTDCKHVVRADVLIDDYIGNLDMYKHYHPFAWTLLYDMPHNQNVNQDGVHTRVRNWEEIVEF